MLKIGCCGFSRSMDAYFRRFSLVEIQKTFYKLPEPETAARWREKAPPDFEFTLKAWQGITHLASSPTYRKAKLHLSEEQKKSLGHFRHTEAVWQAWEQTAEIARLLDARIVVLQCPPNFRESEETRQNLGQFLEKIPRYRLQLAIEFRAPWQQDTIRQLCSRYQVIHCLDPFAHEPVVQQPIAYFRLHGAPPGEKMYRYQYTDADLRTLAQTITEKYAHCEQIYCLFNNLSMWDDAYRFAQWAPGS